jgi:hypothetical protein
MAARHVGEFKSLVLTYESTGSATVTFLTDMPGGAMAVRATFSSSSPCKIENSSSKRKTANFPLDGIVGALYQLKVVPDSGVQLKLFEGRLWVKVIGEFYDGTCNEYFETDEISFG